MYDIWYDPIWYKPQSDIYVQIWPVQTWTPSIWHIFTFWPLCHITRPHIYRSGLLWFGTSSHGTNLYRTGPDPTYYQIQSTIYVTDMDCSDLVPAPIRHKCTFIAWSTCYESIFDILTASIGYIYIWGLFRLGTSFFYPILRPFFLNLGYIQLWALFQLGTSFFYRILRPPVLSLDTLRKKITYCTSLYTDCDMPRNSIHFSFWSDPTWYGPLLRFINSYLFDMGS